MEHYYGPYMNRCLHCHKSTRGSVGCACVAHLSFCFEETLYRAFHRYFLPSFGSFVQAVSEDKIFFKLTNQKQEWRPCFLTDRDEMSNVYRGSTIDASYQVSVQLAKRIQRRI